MEMYLMEMLALMLTLLDHACDERCCRTFTRGTNFSH